MGRVKQAVLEVDDFVSLCVRDGRTLNQTIRDAREESSKTDNPYVDGADFVEDKYYQFKGAW